ncbi:hypothetical protein NX772_01525 [Mesomycoplasma molare]|uniref:Uncharacterized protein n=1 Tax=Mesomycoplasma molare TaxID=171288 RepID=A0ABY5TZ40_9BACT|nr:hypothetical protein [Mesomycoplasma molare]UWD34493.1 hypothetical protein NX772_01525 [Mesomycoplasma molare]
MNKIDLTNYNNFYKNDIDLKTLKEQLYELANEQEWNYFYNADDKEFNEFFNHNEDTGKTWLKNNLTIEQLMYFIEKTKGYYYSFWTFAEYNEKAKDFFEYPKFHGFYTQGFSEYKKQLANAQSFEIPTEELESELEQESEEDFGMTM